MNHAEKPLYGFIGCRINTGEQGGIMPHGNLIGTVLLYQILSAALREQIQLPGLMSGPLNQSSFVFQVNEIGPALKTLEAALQPSTLRPLVTILYYDVAELIWRVQGPNPANVQCGDFSLEKMSAEQAVTLNHLSAARAASNPSAPEQP